MTWFEFGPGLFFWAGPGPRPKVFEGVKVIKKKKTNQDAHVRADAMATLYREGFTHDQIGKKYGISRERVRQLLAKYTDATGARRKLMQKTSADKAAKKAAFLEARCMEKWGVSRDEQKAYRASGVVRRYEVQKRSANLRGIPWQLTFGQWLSVWNDSGKLDQRGRGKDFYCMSRIKDSGPYAIGNVEIKTNSDNAKEATLQWIGKRKKNRGVFLIYPGRARAWMAKLNKKSLGYFETEQEAIAARESALDQLKEKKSE